MNEMRCWRLLETFILIMIAITAGRLLERHYNPTVKPLAATEEQKIQHVLERDYNQYFPRSELLAKTLSMAHTLEGIDIALLVGVIRVETTMIPRNNPQSGAVGFMQIKPAYWKDSCPQYHIHDTYENILAGACVLRSLREDFVSDREALIVYNLGRGNYFKHVKLDAGNKYAASVLHEADLFTQRMAR